MNAALLLALDTVAVGLAVLRARTPGTPPGDADDVHEDNTWDLPNGNPIRRAFKRFAKRQLKKMLGTLPAIGAPLPEHFSLLAPDWTDPMASAMTPLISAYWDESGRTTRAKLGLDTDQWEVHDPHLHQMIRQSTLKFCKSTNETTDLQLADALDQLRDELAAGLVEHGESIPELAARVRSVFGRLSGYRAEMIARTEASRAVHAASQESARESGVVQGKRWLVSENSCDKCKDVARQVNESHPRGLPLDQPFVSEQSKQEEYASVPHPPLHPHCRCSVTFVLTDEYEELLKLHPPGSDFEPGPLGPEVKKREVAKPAAEPKPRPARKPKAEPAPQSPPPVSYPILPGRPLAERLAAWTEGDNLVAAIAKLERGSHEEVKRTAKELVDYAQGKTPKELKTAGVKARMDELQTAANEAFRQRYSHDIIAREAVINIAAPKRKVAWKTSEAGPVPDGLKGQINKGQAYVESLLGAPDDPLAPGNAIAIKYHAHPAGYRAHAGYGNVHLAEKDDASTAAHEIGHCIEDDIPGAWQMEKEFIALRAGNEARKKFKDLFPTRNYRDDEEGVEDDFGRFFNEASGFDKASAYYVGKHYDNRSEVLSMGLQGLHDNPGEFARKDPQFCKLILGILGGALR